jgi:Fe-S cluster biogenesis protein NfuA
MPEAREFQSRMQKLDAMLQEADETADPAAQARLQNVTANLLDLHRAGLQRILDFVSRSGSGSAILDSFARDELIGGLLVLHDLHPLDLEARVRVALEKVAPYAASHGGHIELVSITADGVVHLRLDGSCHGCPSSRVTLQSSIEQEIYAAAPEVTSIVAEGLAEETPPPHGGLVQLGINGNVLQAVAS